MTFEFVHWREEPDERELLRLDIVGLAAEVATLSTRIHEDLLGIFSPEVPRLTELRRSLSERSLSLLAPQASFDGISMSAMRATLDLLREDQRRIMELRREAECLAEGCATWLSRYSEVPDL